MGKANKKKQPIKPPDTGTHTINYEKMRDIMIEAMRVVRDEEREKQLKNRPTDTLTDSMRQILSGVIIILIVVFSIGIIVASVYSIEYGKNSQNTMLFISTVAFWTSILIFFVIIWALEFVQKMRLLIKEYKVIKWTLMIFFIAATLLMIVSLLYMLFYYRILGALMGGSLAASCFILLLFMLRKGIMEEKDRSFLASYFSAMVSFMALVASITALVITVAPNNS